MILRAAAVVQASGGLTEEQLAFFKPEGHGPDCLMELRYLDDERRQEGARYIADHGCRAHCCHALRHKMSPTTLHAHLHARFNSRQRVPSTCRDIARCALVEVATQMRR